MVMRVYALYLRSHVVLVILVVPLIISVGVAFVSIRCSEVNYGRILYFHDVSFQWLIMGGTQDEVLYVSGLCLRKVSAEK